MLTNTGGRAKSILRVEKRCREDLTSSSRIVPCLLLLLLLLLLSLSLSLLLLMSLSLSLSLFFWLENGLFSSFREGMLLTVYSVTSVSGITTSVDPRGPMGNCMTTSVNLYWPCFGL